MFRAGFFREHSSLLVMFHLTLDLITLLVSGSVCYLILLPHYPSPERYILVSLIASILMVPVFSSAALYVPWRGASKIEESRSVVFAMVSIFFILVLLMFITKTSTAYSRLWTGSWFLSSTMFICILRIWLRSFLSFLRLHGHNLRHVIILSKDGLGVGVVEEITKSSQIGYRIEGYYSNDAEEFENIENGISTGSIFEGVECIKRDAIDQVWLAFPLSAEKQIKLILESLPYVTADIRLIPNFFGFKLINHSISHIGDLPVINLSVTPMDGLNRLMKNLEDRILASLLLTVISPILLVIAIGIKLGSPGPILYRQERVSWNGNIFHMIKFRSMPIDAEATTGAVWSKKGEHRATPFGSFLRRTSLDELPQFWNVLRGDMSIVGPRPERPFFVDKLREEIPGYMKKHMVKAGITGWAQVNGWRGNTDLKERVAHDLYYVENWSLFFDIKIMVLTLFKGFINKNAY